MEKKKQSENQTPKRVSAVNQLGITPGPWYISGLDIMSEIGCVCDCDISGIPARNLISNLRLISAAPEMYEALLWIKENNDLKYINPIFVKILNNALNKAEGNIVD